MNLSKTCMDILNPSRAPSYFGELKQSLIKSWKTVAQSSRWVPYAQFIRRDLVAPTLALELSSTKAGQKHDVGIKVWIWIGKAIKLIKFDRLCRVTRLWRGSDSNVVLMPCWIKLIHKIWKCIYFVLFTTALISRSLLSFSWTQLQLSSANRNTK